MMKIIDEDLNSDVFKALSDIAFDYEVNKEEPVYREDFEEAEENFNDRFFAGYDREDYEESLDESKGPYQNPNFDEEKFGKYFDDNNQLIPELRGEWFDAMRAESEGIDESLTEAAPRDVMKGYDVAGRTGEKRRQEPYDFNNASYDEITPEEALKLVKTNPEQVVMLINDRTGRERAVRFGRDGRTEINGTYNYRFDLPDDKAYVNKRGKNKGELRTDIHYIPNEHLFSVANKIYKTNETTTRRDQNIRQQRAANAVGAYGDGYYRERNRLNNNPRYDFNKFSSQPNTEVLYNASDSRLMNIFKQALGPYGSMDLPAEVTRRIHLLPTGRVYWNSSYALGNTGDPNVGGSAKDFAELFIDYLNRWSIVDSDTWAAWQGYTTAKTGSRELVPPTHDLIKELYEKYAPDVLKEVEMADVRRKYYDKDRAAAERYLDVQAALQRPIEAAKKAASAISNLEQQEKNLNNEKTTFQSPTSRAQRSGRIQSNIDYYKNRLKEIIAELEGYEMKLDDLDASDAKQIAEYDQQIADIQKRIQDMKNNRSNVYKNTSFGNKVPESLEEGKSLAEIVGGNIPIENEALEEKEELKESKLIWSSNMTSNYIKSLPLQEKYNILTEEFGYDPEMMGEDIDTAIDNDAAMWQGDMEDYTSNIAPMINGQTSGGRIIAVNHDDLQAKPTIMTTDGLLNNGPVSIYDDGDGLYAQYDDSRLDMYSVPGENDRNDFIANVMPEYNNWAVDRGYEEDDDYFWDEPLPDFDEDETLETYVNRDALKDYGKRIKNTLEVS